MSDSILATVKKMIGGADSATYDHFDEDLIIHINMAFVTLSQLMANTQNPFRITGDTEKWSDLGIPAEKLGVVQDYIYIRTRILFDPPDSSFVLESLKETMNELSFRIQVEFGES